MTSKGFAKAEQVQHWLKSQILQESGSRSHDSVLRKGLCFMSRSILWEYKYVLELNTILLLF